MAEPTELAKRVASRFLAGEESDDIVAALPKSKPGLQMFKGHLEKMMEAIEGGDSDTFDSEMGRLHGAWKKVNP
jgi:hypothetical protein